MATFSEALKDLINTFPNVTALIGTLPNMRFAPAKLPQPPITYPFVTWQLVDGVGVYSHDGYSNVTDPRIQITIWSQTYLSGELVRNALCANPPNGLNGYRGTQSGVKFDRIFVQDGITVFEPVTQIHQRTLDLLMSIGG